MFSIQTNVNSLIAQENMRVNGDFQSKTIQRLTSGYRINQSGDDAAGLAVANKFRSDVAELSQGVRNANDGISTLQIIDGGMNNISKMIDRLKTLASQSASETFTGDRKVLNDEFQTLLKEIDRQAQAVGLDQGGLYAKSLSVFVGGGRSAALGAVDTSNGTVKLDLAAAAVDTKSLSLKGMQAVAGSDTTDIGTGSATHTVADILADNGNTTDLAGYTNFYISGAGFSDDNKVKVAVNMTGVSDIDTLATAINDAIDQAATGGSSAATAFKNAGVSASVYTNENGGKQLAFNSSYAPIQVQAGDVMANALMGNFSTVGGDPATRGAAMSSSVHGVNTTAGTLGAGDVTVRIVGGGLSSPVDIKLDGGQTTASAIASLTSQISANADLVAAGLSVSSGAVGSSPLTFTNSRGDKFSVQASGDTTNLLGLGSFNSGAANAVDYTTLSGTVYTASTTSDTSTLEISLNGGAAEQITVDLTAGNASAAKELSGVVGSNDIDGTNDTLNLTIDGQSVAVSLTHNTGVSELTVAGEIQAAVDGAGLTGGAHATVSVTQDGRIQIENDNKGGAHTLLAAGNAVSSGLLAFTLTAGSNRTAGDIADNINQQIAASSNLQKAGLKATVDAGALKLDSNGTFFRVNGGAVTGDANIGFGVSASSFTGAAATDLAATTSARASVDSNGAQQTSSMAFTAPTYATDSQTLTVSVNDADGNIQSQVISLHNDTTARSARSIDEAVAAINKQLQQSNIAALQGIVAVKENVSGTEKINFLSSGNSFQVSASGTTNSAGVDGNGTAAGTAGSVESEVAGDVSSTISIDSMSNALKAVTSISAAITKLGSAQAAVGRGQNQLSYALSLAQSQISSFSAAESRIRDADVASEAANLTKAQVLQQAAVAAMAQANSAPQVILSLLRG
ncbi:flagellin [uncultured Paludibaculum sp.]|uniref:flagellin N-terminal helical domain-containing protein n=1 Tax=uncultured Paludibaculum sp. TaxID=1765020 RepID=UPI002AAA9C2E|nr:flagellin [uncultured Paludibaculum sp.]